MIFSTKIDGIEIKGEILSHDDRATFTPKYNMDKVYKMVEFYNTTLLNRSQLDRLNDEIQDFAKRYDSDYSPVDLPYGVVFGSPVGLFIAATKAGKMWKNAFLEGYYIKNLTNAKAADYADTVIVNKIEEDEAFADSKKIHKAVSSKKFSLDKTNLFIEPYDGFTDEQIEYFSIHGIRWDVVKENGIAYGKFRDVMNSKRTNGKERRGFYFRNEAAMSDYYGMDNNTYFAVFLKNSEGKLTKVKIDKSKHKDFLILDFDGMSLDDTAPLVRKFEATGLVPQIKLNNKDFEGKVLPHFSHLFEDELDEEGNMKYNKPKPGGIQCFLPVSFKGKPGVSEADVEAWGLLKRTAKALAAKYGADVQFQNDIAKNYLNTDLFNVAHKSGSKKILHNRIRLVPERPEGKHIARYYGGDVNLDENVILGEAAFAPHNAIVFMNDGKTKFRLGDLYLGIRTPRGDSKVPFTKEELSFGGAKDNKYSNLKKFKHVVNCAAAYGLSTVNGIVDLSDAKTWAYDLETILDMAFTEEEKAELLNGHTYEEYVNQPTFITFGQEKEDFLQKIGKNVISFFENNWNVLQTGNTTHYAVKLSSYGDTSRNRSLFMAAKALTNAQLETIKSDINAFLLAEQSTLFANCENTDLLPEGEALTIINNQLEENEVNGLTGANQNSFGDMSKLTVTEDGETKVEYRVEYTKVEDTKENQLRVQEAFKEIFAEMVEVYKAEGERAIRWKHDSCEVYEGAKFNDNGLFKSVMNYAINKFGYTEFLANMESFFHDEMREIVGEFYQEIQGYYPSVSVLATTVRQCLIDNNSYINQVRIAENKSKRIRNAEANRTKVKDEHLQRVAAHNKAVNIEKHNSRLATKAANERKVFKQLEAKLSQRKFESTPEMLRFDMAVRAWDLVEDVEHLSFDATVSFLQVTRKAGLLSSYRKCNTRAEAEVMLQEKGFTRKEYHLLRYVDIADRVIKVVRTLKFKPNFKALEPEEMFALTEFQNEFNGREMALAKAIYEQMVRLIGVDKLATETIMNHGWNEIVEAFISIADLDDIEEMTYAVIGLTQAVKDGRYTLYDTRPIEYESHR